MGAEGQLTQLNITAGLPPPTGDENGELSYAKAPKFDKCTDKHDYREFNKAPKGKSYEA